MGPTSSRFVRRAALTVACAGTLIAGLVVPTVSSSAAPRPPASVPLPAVAGSRYLALGDSVTFGFRELNTVPPPNYLQANTFVGYPEDVGAALGLRVTNAACSGETSGSLIDVNAQSNGCEHSATGGPGYRTFFPLHVKYGGSQLAFAVHFLKAHPDTRLVSLMIGANDAFVCQATTADHCVSELPALLTTIEKNITTILTAIRDQADYAGQIVILNYYSLSYVNAAAEAGAKALNLAQDTAAKPFGVEIARGYHAFRVASLHSGANACTAGLLTQLTTVPASCGVHPSVAGQSVLAQAVEAAVIK